MNNPWSLEWLHVNEINHGEHKKKNDTICENMSLMLIALCLKYKQKLIICSRIAPSEKNFNILNTEKWRMLGEMMWQESWSNYCPWYVCSESSHYIPWIYKVSVYLKFFFKKIKKKSIFKIIKAFLSENSPKEGGFWVTQRQASGSVGIL